MFYTRLAVAAADGIVWSGFTMCVRVRNNKCRRLARGEGFAPDVDLVKLNTLLLQSRPLSVCINTIESNKYCINIVLNKTASQQPIEQPRHDRFVLRIVARSHHWRRLGNTAHRRRPTAQQQQQQNGCVHVRYGLV